MGIWINPAQKKSRMLTVSTELSGKSLGEAAAEVEKMLKPWFQCVTWQIAGAIKDQRKASAIWVFLWEWA